MQDYLEELLEYADEIEELDAQDDFLDEHSDV